MPDKLTGEISITHQIGKAVIELDCDTKYNISTTIDYAIDSNTDVSLSKDNNGQIDAKLNIKT